MQTEYWIYFFYLLGGVGAGMVNTLAGGGNIFTLSLLLFFGFPTSLANGTNRLGVLVQNFSGAFTFYRNGFLNPRQNLIYLIPSTIGAIFGAWIASYLDKTTMEISVGILMVFMLITHFRKSKPQKVILSKQRRKIKQILIIPTFLIIGFYGGFLQAGVALFIINALTTWGNMSLIRANASKMLIIMVYTLPALAIFLWKGQVDWIAGTWLALGQIIGTQIAAKFALEQHNSSAWIKKLLLVMEFLAIMQLFHLWDWVIKLF